MKLLGLTVVILTITVWTSCARATSDAMETTVSQEFTRLNTMYGVGASLHFSDSGSTHANPTGDVFVSRDEISRILTDPSVLDKDAVAKFIIGHEMVHELQFKIYSPDVLSKGPEIRRMYECQADMLSAYQLLLSKGITAGSVQTITDMLRVAYEVGEEDYSFSDHPSHEQRRLAARYGFGRAILEGASTAGYNESQLAESKAIASEIIKKIDFRQGESPTAWSLRVCRGITHQDSAAISSIVQGQSHVQWEPTAANPVVHYSVPFKNISARPVHVDMEIVTVIAPTAAPRELSADVLWNRIDVKRFSFDLRPNETHTVSAVLRWERYDMSQLPRVLLFPDPSTLFEAHFISDSGTAPTKAETGSGFQSENSGANTDVASVVMRYANEFSPGGSFAKYLTGTATRDEDPVYDCKDTFKSNLPIPGALKTEIEYSNGKACRVSALLYRGYSEQEATTSFREIDEALATHFKYVDPGLARRDWAFKKYDVPNTSVQAIINFHRVTGGKYSVRLSIRPANE
jgi:hypothetical protein